MNTPAGAGCAASLVLTAAGGAGLAPGLRPGEVPSPEAGRAHAPARGPVPPAPPPSASLGSLRWRRDGKAGWPTPPCAGLAALRRHGAGAAWDSAGRQRGLQSAGLTSTATSAGGRGRRDPGEKGPAACWLLTGARGDPGRPLLEVAGVWPRLEQRGKGREGAEWVRRPARCPPGGPRPALPSPRKAPPPGARPYLRPLPQTTPWSPRSPTVS